MAEDAKWTESRRRSLDFQQKRIEKLRNTKELEPPWKTFPNRSRHAGWRMGAQEDCMIDWRVWLQSLPLNQLQAYQLRHPDIESWLGIYDYYFKNAKPTVNWDKYWDDEFEKQKEQIEAGIAFSKRAEQGSP
jgi:hypothetical protein